MHLIGLAEDFSKLLHGFLDDSGRVQVRRTLLLLLSLVDQTQEELFRP